MERIPETMREAERRGRSPRRPESRARPAQRAAAGPAAAAPLVDVPLRPPNETGMPDGLKTGLETVSGRDLSSVRVRYDSPLPAQMQALAYTRGREIHVAPGQERHLPHEGWHVVQQMEGRVRPTMEVEGVPVNDDPGLEREADAKGAEARRLGDGVKD